MEYWRLDVQNPMRRLGLIPALTFMFFRFTMLHEAIAYRFGTNAYILIVTGFVAIAALFFSNGFRRTLQSRIGWYWVGFIICMGMASVLSTWRGHSLSIFFPYLRTEIIIFFLITGLVMTWREYWMLLSILSLSAFVDLGIGRMFGVAAGEGRLQLEMQSGSVSNSNDLAAHLLLLLPFLLLVLFTPGRSGVLRVAALGGLFIGLYQVLSTGSRGALVGLVVTLLYAVFRLPGRWRLGLAIAVPLITAAFIVTLPRTVLTRLSTVYSSESAQNEEDREVESEAQMSTRARWLLLKETVQLTFMHPLLGVGPGEFADNEAMLAKKQGRHGSWHDTHNTYTQVSSEVGIPGFIVYMAALVAAFRLLNKVYRNANQRPPTVENRRMALAALCMMLSMAAFCGSVFFLSFAYSFYVPALTGLAFALSRAVESEWASQELNQAAA